MDLKKGRTERRRADEGRRNGPTTDDAVRCGGEKGERTRNNGLTQLATIWPFAVGTINKFDVSTEGADYAIHGVYYRLHDKDLMANFGDIGCRF